jgi:hypothetical protein
MFYGAILSEVPDLGKAGITQHAKKRVTIRNATHFCQRQTEKQPSKKGGENKEERGLVVEKN